VAKLAHTRARSQYRRSLAEPDLPNLFLTAVAASYLIQLGGSIFALSVVGRVIIAAPPRSFAILEGAYGYDSSAFWEIMPAITGVLLLAALVANWKTRRRGLLLGALALFVLTGIVMGTVIGPMFSELVAGGYQDAVDPALQSRALTWYVSDWSARGLDVAAIATLLTALSRPAATPLPQS
jgi:hypothetical protein